MVIDPETRELKSHEQKIVVEGQKMIRDKVKAEMHQAVVEVGTDICRDIQKPMRMLPLLTENHFTDRRRPGPLGWRIRNTSLQPLGKPAHYRSCTIQ